MTATSDEASPADHGLPDPTASRAVVIGLSDYESKDFPPVPATRESAKFWRRLFTAPYGWNLPEEHCTLLLDERGHVRDEEILDAVVAASRAAADALAVVFCGHATTDRREDLHWVLTRERDRNVRTWGLAFDRVVGAMNPVDRPGAARRLVVLDCCFAGAAAHTLSGEDAVRTEIEERLRRVREHHDPQLFLACAAPKDSVANARSAGGLTGFTQAVHDTVKQFRAGEEPVMRVGELMTAVTRRLVAPGGQRPVSFTEGPAHAMPLLTRRAWDPYDRLPSLIHALAQDVSLCAASSSARGTGHAPVVLRVEGDPSPGRHTLHDPLPDRLPRDDHLELLGVIPRDTDVPVCLLARAWARRGVPADGVRALLMDLALVCHVGQARNPARSGAPRTHGTGGDAAEPAVVLTLDPARLPQPDDGTAVRLRHELLDGARTLLPPEEAPRTAGEQPGPCPAGPSHWPALPLERAGCGTLFLRRHLPALLMDARLDEEARELVESPDWIRSTLRDLRQAGPVAAGVRRVLGDAPPASGLSRIAHLLRPGDDTSEVLGARLGDRYDPGPTGAPARLKLLVPDEEPPGVLHVFVGHHRPGPRCSVDTDGTLAVSVDGTDRLMRLWDPATGEDLGRIGSPGGRFTSCGLLHGSKRAVTVCEQGRILLWDCRAPGTGPAEDTRIPYGAGRRILGVVEDFVLVGDPHGLGVLQVGSPSAGGLKAVAHLRHPRMAGAVAAPVAQGLAVLVITEDWYAHRWTLRRTPAGTASASLERSFTPFTRREDTLGTAPPSTRCAGCCAAPAHDGGIPVLLFGRFPDEAVHAVWRPDGDARDPTHFELDAAARWEFGTYHHLTSGAFSPDGTRLVVVDGDGKPLVLVRDAADPPLPLPVRWGTAAAVWIPDSAAGTGHRFLTFDNDGRIRAWDAGAAPAAAGTEYALEVPVGTPPTLGNTVVVPRADGTVTLHHGTSARPGTAHDRGVRVLASTPLAARPAPTTPSTQKTEKAQDSLLALGLSDGAVRLVGAEGQVVRTFPAHRAAVTALAAPWAGAVAGRPAPVPWLLTASRTGEVRLWDLSTTAVEWGTVRRIRGEPLLACATAQGTRAVVCAGEAVHVLPTPGTPGGSAAPAEDGSTTKVSSSVTALCADPAHDGRVFAAGHARLFKIFPESGRPRAEEVACPEHTEITALAVDRCTGLLAACDVDGLITVRGQDLSTPLAGHRLTGLPVGAAWLPDGRLAVTSTAGVAVLQAPFPNRRTAPQGPPDER